MELLNAAGVHFPAVVSIGPGTLSRKYFFVFSGLRFLGSGTTISEAMADAWKHENLAANPPRLNYGYDANRIIFADEIVATAKSNTLARRIANALNLYNPNERGR